MVLSLKLRGVLTDKSYLVATFVNALADNGMLGLDGLKPGAGIASRRDGDELEREKHEGKKEGTHVYEEQRMLLGRGRG